MTAVEYLRRYEQAMQATAAAAPRGLVAEAAALAQQIRWNPDRLVEFSYTANMELATTCCCHLVVDDDNVHDYSVAFCLMQAARLEHRDCLRLAKLLVRASLTQRRKIARQAWR